MNAARGAELDAGQALGFFGAETAGDVFRALLVEVRGDFIGEITVLAAAMEEAEVDHAG